MIVSVLWLFALMAPPFYNSAAGSASSVEAAAASTRDKRDGSAANTAPRAWHSARVGARGGRGSGYMAHVASGIPAEGAFGDC